MTDGPRRPERRAHRRTTALGTVNVRWSESRHATFALANLSTGGAFLCGGPPIPVGTRITVELRDREIFRLEATVVRVHASGDGSVDIAVAFEPKSKDDDRP